jgi:tripartite-type tricarboxylate transporter receptor subunit TctC
VALAAGLALAVGSAATGAAQDKYPSRALNFIVPFPAGGSVDLTARALQSPLEKILAQPIVIQNRGGASGAIGTRAAAVADPDGYTLMMSTTQVSVLPEVDRLFERRPSFTRDQFTPIARLSADPVMLVVNAKRPWKSVKELVDDARKRPGEIDYSHGGIYGATHLPVEMFAQAAGIKMQQIPTQGGGPAMTAALGNTWRCSFRTQGLASRTPSRVPCAHSRAWAPSALPPIRRSPRSRSSVTTSNTTYGRGFSRPQGPPSR